MDPMLGPTCEAKDLLLGLLKYEPEQRLSPGTRFRALGGGDSEGNPVEWWPTGIQLANLAPCKTVRF